LAPCCASFLAASFAAAATARPTNGAGISFPIHKFGTIGPQMLRLN
jgi:hypothetical protein